MDDRVSKLAAALERDFRTASGFRVLPIKATFTPRETIEIKVGEPHGITYVYEIGTDDDDLVFRSPSGATVRMPIPPEFTEFSP